MANAAAAVITDARDECRVTERPGREADKLLRRVPAKVTVLGSGSYGTATATHLARRGYEAWMLTRRPEVVTAVTRTHTNPLTSFSDFSLPFNLVATQSAEEALRGTTLIVHCIPTQASFEYLRSLRDAIPPHVLIVSTSKGLYVVPTPPAAAVAAASSLPSPSALSPCAPLPGEVLMMSRLIPAALGRPQPVCVLSGPTFADEVLRGFPTGAVIAATDPALAAAARAAFESHTFRVWTSADVVGVELAGAFKNVYALAAGCVEGLGLGLNTIALLCTRAIAEMGAVARALGAHEATLAGLSGVGDLMLTAFGKASRNRTVGVRLGQGESLAAVLASTTEVAEGMATAPVALQLARSLGVRVPIVEAVCAVLEGRVAPISALLALLQVPTGEERFLE